MPWHQCWSKMKINMKLLPIKAHYFLLFAGTAPILPFLPVYARQQGFSDAGIGIIYTILPFIGLIMKTASGAISDWLRIHRGIIYFTPAVPQKPNNELAHARLDCNGSSTFFSYCISQDKCGHNDFLNSIVDNYTVNCQVRCGTDEEDTGKICDAWNVSSSCQNSEFNFTASTNLFDNDRGDRCTYFPISNVTAAGKEVIEPTCPALSTVNCSLLCDDGSFMNYLGAPLTIPPSTYDELLSYHQFWIYLVCFIVAWCGLAITVVMSDTICFKLLGAEGNKYGEQRLFGSVGWGLLVVVAGGLIDYASLGRPEKDYTPAFVLSLAILFLDLLAATRLEVEGSERRTGTAGSVARLICEPRIVLFILCCIVLLLVEDIAFKWDCHFGALKLLQGLIMGVQCFGGELPFFFLSGWFIKKLGHVHAMSLVIAVFGIRFILYYTLANPWLFLPVELLNGFTFGIFYATMTSYASHVAPSGTEATMQGIVGAAFEGIGIATGGFVGGSLYFSVGGSKTFLYTGIFNLICTVLHVVLQILLSTFRPQSTPAGGSSSPVGYMPPSDSMRPVTANDADAEEDF
ncbi:Major facilitator superfamily domain-containing protein 6-like 8 [Homarus americanus]|uniref:Major facilitator superfamily domain-containing protein 6-like 8 n=1 Tax=Homarus americanus TaxID=6706 RepID=A0A8J5MRU4_HOMAM|nr:Major facilitator superfamily domain-containing protein 6-like 8 [Homarus americanus]